MAAAGEAAAELVLQGSSDLALLVLGQLECAADVRSAAQVCRSFSVAASADSIWAPLCRARWATKWGAEARWANAVRAAEGATGGDGREVWRGWRERYRSEEADAVRCAITAPELGAITWDFRFWLGELPANGGVAQCGVRHCASRCFRFEPGGRVRKLTS
eukprot:SAG11_NODE_5670_length_1490_cov_1.512581_2_plen_160_part_01